MTLLQPGVRRDRGVSTLCDRDVPELTELVRRDPIVNAVVASRLEAVGTLRPAELGGTMLAVADGAALRGAVFSGGNLIPVEGDPASWSGLARSVARRPRVCTSIVGRAESVAAFWEVLEPVWGRPRGVRLNQPLLVLDRASQLPDAVPDAGVRRATLADLNRYMAASAAMFTDELGQSPYVLPGVEAFRGRVAELIRDGRAFASFDFRGQVVFKADLGVVSEHTCQIQGVWLRPDLRGRGLATGAMAAIIRHALTLAPTVSLYVNDFNTAARSLYARLGMRQHATLATVLL